MWWVLIYNKSFRNTKILKCPVNFFFKCNIPFHTLFNVLLNYNINLKSVFYWLTLQNNENLIYVTAEALKSRAGYLVYRRILLFGKMTSTALLKYVTVSNISCVTPLSAALSVTRAVIQVSFVVKILLRKSSSAQWPNNVVPHRKRKSHICYSR